MSDPRPEKVAMVNEVREKLEAAEAVLITEYRGLTVSELAELRGSMRGGGGEYRVYKNTFVRRAAAELELDIGEHLTGPTALAFVGLAPDTTGDVAAVAKAIRDFAKGNPLLVVKGGVLGDQILDAAATTALASLPTASEVYSRLAGAVNDGARGMAGVLAGTYRSVAYALQAVIDSGHFGGDAAPAADTDDLAPAEETDATVEPETTAEPAAEADGDAVADAGGDEESGAAEVAPEMSTDNNDAADDAADENNAADDAAEESE